MEFTWFDLAIAALMIISALLAMMRGFTREVTALAAWGGAIAAGVYAAFRPELVAKAQEYFAQEMVARLAVGGIVFIIVLIVLSLISIRLTDWLLDSAPGAFDRTLGGLFGLARGLVLVVVLYLFYIWLVPVDTRFDAIRKAATLPYLEKVAIEFTHLIPGEKGENLRNETYAVKRKNNGATNGTQMGNTTGKTDAIGQQIQQQQGNKTNRTLPPIPPATGGNTGQN